MTNTAQKLRPQVLLLGNGLNIGHNGIKWGALMKEIRTNPEIPDGITLSGPMPLQAIIETADHVDSALKKYRKAFYGVIADECQRNMLKDLLTAGFDHILTTNYSYELESVAFGVKSVSDYLLKKHLRHIAEDDVKRAETKYLLHTYYEGEIDGVLNKIWHIHGEARKPDSMIFGHYYYGNLLKRYFQLLDERGKVYLSYDNKGKIFPVRSWIDAFILGDVYILGFGYDLSEFDLWWLLNRKKREKADVGEVFFYESSDSKAFDERLELLKLMNVRIQSLEVGENDGYDSFYQAAIQDIVKKVKNQNYTISI